MKKLLVLLPALVMALVFSTTLYTTNAQAKNYRHHGHHFNNRGHHGNNHFKYRNYRYGNRHFNHHNDYRSYNYGYRGHRHHPGCGHYRDGYYGRSGAHFSIYVPLFDHFYYRH